MSVSPIGASPSAYLYDSTADKKDGDPMSQAIAKLQSSDPTLASKLGDLQKQVDSMKKSGASQKDIQSTIKQTMDGLSGAEKSELKSAMPAPRAGGRRHHHGAQASGAAAASPSVATDASSAATASSPLLDISA